MNSPQDPAVEPLATKRVRGTWTATALAAAWAGALTLLAFEWTRSPLTGSGRALLIFSMAALPVAAFTWIWLRRFPALRIPLGFGTLALIIVAWAAAGMIVVTAPGDEWLLDGLILRRPLLRAGGVALWWAPGVWGLVLSIAGLAATLEARYQITHYSGSDGVPERTRPNASDVSEAGPT